MTDSPRDRHIEQIDVEVFYPPGAFFVTQIGGRTGWWVALGQAIAGRPSRWTHAGIIGYNGQTFEAAPGGVHYGTVNDLAKKPHMVSDAPVMDAVDEAFLPLAVGTREGYEKDLRQRVVDQAEQLLGTPYSFFDYVALAGLHLAPRSRFTKWARKRVQDSKHYICSALVDETYRRAGIHLFTDGRYPGDVMPADLDWWIDDHKGKQ
jgi:hypothetical protein